MFLARVDAIVSKEARTLGGSKADHDGPYTRTLINPVYFLSQAFPCIPQMPSWTLIDTHPTRGRTFQRPLDALERWFFWHGIFNGAADGLQYCEIRLLDGSQDAHLFSEANIVKAWLSTKRRYPLAGAILRGADGVPLRLDATTDSETGNGTESALAPYFIVREYDLSVLHPHEVVFGSVASAEEAQRHMTTIMDGPRPISTELLTQLYVFRETDPERTNVLHLIILIAHCVTDRVAINTFVRCLLDTLARGGGSEPAQVPLEDRLAMSIPSMDLMPMHLCSLSPAIRRWRRAVGIVILQLKMEKRQVCLVSQTFFPCRFDGSINEFMINLVGRVHTPLSPHAFNAGYCRNIWPCLHLAHAHTNHLCDCQLSSARHHIWKCLPGTRASGDDSAALPTVSARRDLGGGMGVS